MIDPKEAYRKILEEHLHDLQTNKNIFHLNSYDSGRLDSRYHILELLGFRKDEIDTSEKVIKIIEKYKIEEESWRQTD